MEMLNLTPKINYNMNIEISSNFKLAPRSKNNIENKFSNLHNHSNDILSIQIHCERSEHTQPHSVKGILELKGKTIVVTKSNKDMRKCLDLVYSKLDRNLRRRARIQKIKRRLNFKNLLNK